MLLVPTKEPDYFAYIFLNKAYVEKYMKGKYQLENILYEFPSYFLNLCIISIFLYITNLDITYQGELEA